MTLTQILTSWRYEPTEQFKELGFEYGFRQGTVIVVAREYKSIDELFDQWKKDQEILAAEVQSRLEPALRWDIYFLLLVDKRIEETELRLVQQVQDDLFCARKVVIEMAEDRMLQNLKQLPFAELIRGENDLVTGLWDRFLNRLSTKGYDKNFLERCRGKKLNEVIDELLLLAIQNENKPPNS